MDTKQSYAKELSKKSLGEAGVSDVGSSGLHLHFSWPTKLWFHQHWNMKKHMCEKCHKASSLGWTVCVYIAACGWEGSLGTINHHKVKRLFSWVWANLTLIVKAFIYSKFKTNKQQSCNSWTCEYIKVPLNSDSQDKGIPQGKIPPHFSEDCFTLILKDEYAYLEIQSSRMFLAGKEKTFFILLGKYISAVSLDKARWLSSLNQARAEHLVKGSLGGRGKPGERQHQIPSAKQISSTPLTQIRHTMRWPRTQVSKNSLGQWLFSRCRDCRSVSI